MATIDVSDILMDADFLDRVPLIMRQSMVSDNGESYFVEQTKYIIVVIQAADGEVLNRLPEGARLSDTITVYTKERLYPERPGGYADVIVWQGRRYQVKEIIEDNTNWGAGFVKALCMQEAASV